MRTEKNLKKWTKGIRKNTHTPDSEGIMWSVKDNT